MNSVILETTRNAHQLLVRVATPQDAAAILAVYAPYITDTAITFEYEIPSVEEFAGRIENTLKRYPYIVLEEDGILVGYAYVGTFHAREAYNWDCETSIYVAMDKKGCGYGRLLYDELEKLLKMQHISNLYACIAYVDEDPESPDPYLNNDSMRFHEHLGYKLVGTFRQCGYKFRRWYHMIWMERMIGGHPEKPQDFIPFSKL